MEIIFKTNASTTTKSMTEWFFGKRFVADAVKTAIRERKATGKASFKFWKEGTGYLTVMVQG